MPQNALTGNTGLTNILKGPSAANDIDQLKQSLQKNAISGQVQNANFILNSQGGVPSTAAVAVSQNAMKADASYADLKNQVRQTNDISIQRLRTEYDDKIKVWKSNYDTSIKSYKEYVSELEKKQQGAEQKNQELIERLTKNENKLNDAVKKFTEVQDNISKYEKQLLIKGSDTEKQSSTIKQLQLQLAEENKKQDSITSKLARLKEEKQTLDQAYLSNLTQLKKVGLGSNCPPGVNMNDYILKKNIPCWGCILK
jgi:chromosome segregation ATPase